MLNTHGRKFVKWYTGGKSISDFSHIDIISHEVIAKNLKSFKIDSYRTFHVVSEKIRFSKNSFFWEVLNLSKLYCTFSQSMTFKKFFFTILGFSWIHKLSNDVYNNVDKFDFERYFWRKKVCECKLYEKHCF